MSLPIEPIFANSQDVEPMTATATQFGKLLLRMMPKTLAEMPEGKFMVAIFTQAWTDVDNYSTARLFFTQGFGRFNEYCDKMGLNAEQIKEIYLKHHRVNSELAA